MGLGCVRVWLIGTVMPGGGGGVVELGDLKSIPKIMVSNLHVVRTYSTK